MSHLDDLLKQATNPVAYDNSDTEWAIENGKDSSRQDIYREYFSPYKSEWSDKDVLDIGSGAGWLLNFFMQNGAKSVLGVEPSRKNVEATKVLYPDIDVLNENFMAINMDRKFDFITAVMVMTNLPDVKSAFKKFKTLMNNKAKLLVVVPDYDYFKTPRHDYGLDVEVINSKEYVIETKRPNAVLTDIVRMNEVYIEAAELEGLMFIESIAMLPTTQFTEQLPQYSGFKAQPIMHLLRFTVE